jgi:hypothetical protein
MPSTGPLSQNSRLVATLCMLRSQRPAALLEPSPPDCMRLLFDHVHPPHLERINAHCYRLSLAGSRALVVRLRGSTCRLRFRGSGVARRRVRGWQ